MSIMVCHLVSGDLWAGAENQVYNIIAGIHESSQCDTIAIVMNKGRLYAGLNDLGIKTFLVDEKRVSLIGQFLKILSIIRNERVDILHSHRYKENIIAGLIKLWKRNLILVKTQHGTLNIIRNMSSFRMKIYRLIDLLFTKISFSKIIGVSIEISNQFEKYIHGNKIDTIHNSIYLNRYQVKEKKYRYSQVFDNSMQLAIIGRLVKVKNIDEFIEITKTLDRLNCNCVSHIVGSGPEENHLKKAGGELVPKHIIQFLGEINNISEVYNKIDILFITSIHEGMPTVLLEGMYFGKIIISRSTGGIPDVLTHNVNGFLYDNITQAVDLVMKISKDPLKYEYIRTNAKETVLQKYTNSIQAKMYINTYINSLNTDFRGHL